MIEQATSATQSEVEHKPTGDILVVRVQVPGIDPEKDVEISIADGVLRIKAERLGETTEEKDGSFSFDFHYGLFERAVRVPSETTMHDVKASYTDGILEVRCPHPDRLN